MPRDRVTYSLPQLTIESDGYTYVGAQITRSHPIELMGHYLKWQSERCEEGRIVIKAFRMWRTLHPHHQVFHITCELARGKAH